MLLFVVDEGYKNNLKDECLIYSQPTILILPQFITQWNDDNIESRVTR